MFIDPSTISRLAPSNGARGGCCTAAYRHLTPNRGETASVIWRVYVVPFESYLRTETFDSDYSKNSRVTQNKNERSKR
jgi:hypothetical protein